MNIHEKLILGNRALPEPETLTTLDIYSRAKLLGTELADKKVLEGKITFKKCYIFSLQSIQSNSPLAEIMPDRAKSDFYLIRIPFTLHPAPGDNYYKKVTFFIKSVNRDVTAFDLQPRDVATKVEITKAYTISPQIKFKEIELTAGEVSGQIHFEGLRPTISAFGIGDSTFYWIYSGSADEQVYSGTKECLVILDVPQGTKTVEASISYEVVIAKNMFGMWKHKDASSDEYSICWDLNTAQPFPNT